MAVNVVASLCVYEVGLVEYSPACGIMYVCDFFIEFPFYDVSCPLVLF